MSGRIGAVKTAGRVVSPDFSPEVENTDTKGRAAIFFDQLLSFK